MPTLVTKTIKSAAGDYSSLSAWEAGQQGNLVVGDTIQRAECYALADTTAFAIAGSTVDATHYMEIVAASGAEAQMPWNTTTSYRLSASLNPINVSQSYTRIQRIQIETTADDTGLMAIQIAPAAVSVLVRGCYLRRTVQTYTFGEDSTALYGGVDAAGDRYFVNNVIEWDFRTGAGNVYGIHTENHVGGNTYCYNNTVIGTNTATTAKGIYDGFGGIIAKNNLVKGFTGGCFSGMTSGNCTNNASGDATATGTGARVSQTFTFVGAGDYHLAVGDTGAKDFGVNLSADAAYAFSDDFDGVTRTGTWDIGANEVTGSASGPPIDDDVFLPYMKPVIPEPSTMVFS